MNEEGPGIFDDEDSSPANLWSQILDIHSALVSQSNRMYCIVFGVGKQGAIRTTSDAQLVLRAFGLPRQNLVNLSRAGTTVNGDGLRQCADRFS